MRNHNKTVDIAFEKCLQEFGIILKRDTSIRLTIGAKHVGVRKHARASIHIATANGIKPNSLNTVKRLFSQSKTIIVRRSRSSTFYIYVLRII